jgi:hypothetical protein
MSDEKKPYREGGDEKELPEQEKKKDDAFLTAFLVVQLPDGKIDVITDLPEILKKHTATLREVRDLAHAVYAHTQAELTGKASAMHFTQTMFKAAQMNQSRNIQGQKDMLMAQIAKQAIDGAGK